MGLMEVKNPKRVLGNIGRDGRAFGHLIENFRDSILNGAGRIEFGIAGVEHTPRR
jgi:hypothetical protein